MPTKFDAEFAPRLRIPSGCDVFAASRAAHSDRIEQDQLIGKARTVGDYLHTKLEALQSQHPLIGDIRGLGMFQGVELVKDRSSKEPAAVAAAKVAYRAFDLGLLVFYLGMFSNVMEITPPLIRIKTEVDESIDILDQALYDVEAGRVSDELVAPFAGW